MPSEPTWWEQEGLHPAQQLIKQIIRDEILVSSSSSSSLETVPRKEESVSATTAVLALHLVAQQQQQQHIDATSSSSRSPIPVLNSSDDDCSNNNEITTTNFIKHHLHHSLVVRSSSSSSSSSISSKAAIRKQLLSETTQGGGGSDGDVLVSLMPLCTIVIDCLIELCISLIIERGAHQILSVSDRENNNKSNTTSTGGRCSSSSGGDYCLLEVIQRDIAPLPLTDVVAPHQKVEHDERRLVLLLWLKQHVLDQSSVEDHNGGSSGGGGCITHFNPSCIFCKGFFRPNVLAMQKWIATAAGADSPPTSNTSPILLIKSNNKKPNSQQLHPSSPSSSSTLPSTTTIIPRSTIRGVLHLWRKRYQLEVKRRFFASWSTFVLDPYKKEERCLQDAFLRGCTKALNIRRVALRHQRAANMKLQRTILMAWWQYTHLIAPLIKRKEIERKRSCLRKMAGVRLERLASEYSNTQLRLRVIHTWRAAYWDVRYHKNLLAKILNIGVKKAKIYQFRRDRYLRPIFQLMKAKTLLGQARLHAEVSRHDLQQTQTLQRQPIHHHQVARVKRTSNSHNVSTISALTVEDVLYGGGGSDNNNPSQYQGGDPNTNNIQYTLPHYRTLVLSGFQKTIFRPWRKPSTSTVESRSYLAMDDPTNWLLGRKHTLQSGAFALWRQAFMNRRAKVFRTQMLEGLVGRGIHKMVAIRVAERTVDTNRDAWSKRSILRKWHSLAIIDRPQQRKNAAHLQQWLLRSTLSRWRRRYEQRQHQTVNMRLASEHRRLKLLSLTFSKKWIPGAYDAIKIRTFQEGKMSNMVEGILHKWSLAASKQGTTRRKEEDVADWFHRTVIGGRILQKWLLKTSQRRASVWFSGIGEKWKNIDILVGNGLITPQSSLHVVNAAKESDSDRLKNVLLRQTLNGGLTGKDMKRLRHTRETALNRTSHILEQEQPATGDDACDADHSSHTTTMNPIEMRRQALTFINTLDNHNNINNNRNTPSSSLSASSPFFDGPFDIADSYRFQRLLRGAFKQWRSEWCVRQMFPTATPHQNHPHTTFPPSSSGLNVSGVVDINNSSRHNNNTTYRRTTPPVESSTPTHHGHYEEDHEVSIELSPSAVVPPPYSRGSHSTTPMVDTPLPQQRQSRQQQQQVYITNSRPPLSALLKSVLQS